MRSWGPVISVGPAPAAASVWNLFCSSVNGTARASTVMFGFASWKLAMASVRRRSSVSI